MGYRVFPCAPGQKYPITAQGFLNASTDAVTITQWWTNHPKANIAISTAGLCVIDIDGSDNTWPQDPDLAQSLSVSPVSLTPRGGRHHIFRQPTGIVPLRSTLAFLAPKVDTRADGGYIIVPPSIAYDKPYQWGKTLELNCPPENLPILPKWVLDLLTVAKSNRVKKPVTAGNEIPEGQRDSTLASLAGTMRRVGMSLDEILAAITQTNQDRCRPPLPDKDIERIARSICRYEPDQVSVAVTEHHWDQDHIGQDLPEIPEPPTEPSYPDPGPMPHDLLHIPGFISDVMEFCLTTAPYPNRVMAFCGALALQATLAGRKVRDPGDNRTNIYLLGLAHSAAGKDWPRKINMRVLHAVGMDGCIGEQFASGEGIQDSLFISPCTLFQTDEIDGMLQSINKSRDARHEAIMVTLLSMYSSASNVVSMRRKAGKEQAGTIDQPCLVLFGTAIPNHYYEALSERMLTNGFFSRTIILEGGKRGQGQEPGVLDLPRNILTTAKWWADFHPGKGNLEKWYPNPTIINYTDEARSLLIDTRIKADEEYNRVEKVHDEVSMALWGRVSEQVRKLSLIYAISENHLNPSIGSNAVQWAKRFITHQTHRMLFMASTHVAANPLDADCLQLIRRLRKAPEQTLAHSTLLKRMKTDAKSFLALITTLEQRGDIKVLSVKTNGRPRRSYKLLS